MGFGGISIWQLVIILAIVLLLFGTKRLRGLGSDLGGAIKGFKKAVKDDQEDAKDDAAADEPTPRVDASRTDADGAETAEQQKQHDHTKT